MSGVVIAKPRAKRGRPSRTPKVSIKKAKIDAFIAATNITTKQKEPKKTKILNEMRIRHSPPAIQIWEDVLDNAINDIEIELTEQEYCPIVDYNMIDWYANDSNVETILARHRDWEASRCGHVFEGLSLNMSDDVDDLVKLSQKMLEISQKKTIANELVRYNLSSKAQLAIEEVITRKPNETDCELLQRLTRVNDAISFFIDYGIVHERL